MWSSIIEKRKAAGERAGGGAELEPSMSVEGGPAAPVSSENELDPFLL